MPTPRRQEEVANTIRAEKSRTRSCHSETRAHVLGTRLTSVTVDFKEEATASVGTTELPWNCVQELSASEVMTTGFPPRYGEVPEAHGSNMHPPGSPHWPSPHAAAQLSRAPIPLFRETGHGGAYTQKNPLLKRGLAPVGHLASQTFPHEAALATGQPGRVDGVCQAPGGSGQAEG